MIYYVRMKRSTHHLSPIAFMVRLYHDKYHLNYVHAKKLFVFDILLVLGTLLLMVCTVAWKTYDPTILNYVQLNIAAYDTEGVPLARISSGEPITYIITYNNSSDRVMERPQLTVSLPEFFDITAIRTSNLPYDEATSIFTLPDLRPDQAGIIEIDGVYFGTPDVYENVTVALSYIQQGRRQTEVRHARIISSLRESVLVAQLTAPDIIRATGTYPIRVVLTNTGSITLTDIILSTTTPYGTIVWDSTFPIESLAEKTSTTISGTLFVDIPDSSVQQISLAVTPSLLRAGTAVPQTASEYTMSVVHPSIRIDAATVQQDTAQGGDIIQLVVRITNTGDSPLEEVTLFLPLNSNTIDIGRSRTLSTNATVSDNELRIRTKAILAPLEQATIEVPLAVRAIPQGGTDTRLTLTPRISALAPGSSIPLQAEQTTTPIAIGTSLIVQAESRYFTSEGDQLGRGPLPPIVGQETKYWALITIQNTTSRVAELTVQGSLGTNISWTGRTSVSAGNNISYRASTNQWQYTLSSVAPSQTIGIYMELATTPTEQMRGTVPLLLQNVEVRGFDAYLSTPLIQSIGSIEANLPQDTIGSARGIRVQ